MKNFIVDFWATPKYILNNLKFLIKCFRPNTVLKFNKNAIYRI